MTAWAYLTPQGGMNFVGNGKQCQLPLFDTRKAAMEWVREVEGRDPARIAKVEVAVRKMK